MSKIGTLCEFVLLTDELCAKNKETEVRVFDLLQQVIDFLELDQFLSSYNLLLTKSQLEEILQEIDTDNTKTVDFVEALKVSTTMEMCFQ